METKVAESQLSADESAMWEQMKTNYLARVDAAAPDPRAADDEMIVDGEPPASPQGGNIDDTGLWQVREGAM